MNSHSELVHSSGFSKLYRFIMSEINKAYPILKQNPKNI
jgi:hypothetical protein